MCACVSVSNILSFQMKFEMDTSIILFDEIC